LTRFDTLFLQKSARKGAFFMHNRRVQIIQGWRTAKRLIRSSDAYASKIGDGEFLRTK